MESNIVVLATTILWLKMAGQKFLTTLRMTKLRKTLVYSIEAGSGAEYALLYSSTNKFDPALCIGRGPMAVQLDRAKHACKRECEDSPHTCPVTTTVASATSTYMADLSQLLQRTNISQEKRDKAAWMYVRCTHVPEFGLSRQGLEIMGELA